MKLPNKQKYFIFGVFIFVFSLIFVFHTEAFSLPSKAKINETIQNIRTLKVPEFISEASLKLLNNSSEIIPKTTAAVIPTIGELIQGAMKVGKNVIGAAKDFFADATSSPQTAVKKVEVEQVKAPAQEIGFSLPKISISDEELKIPEIQKISEIKAPQFVTEKEKVPYEPITPVRVVRISVVGDIASDVWNRVTNLLSPDEKLVVVDETTNLKINTATTESEKTKLEFSLPKVSISDKDLKIPEVSKINVPQFITEKESAPYQLIEPIRTIRISVIGDIASDVWNKILAIFKKEKVVVVEPEKPAEEKIAEAPAAAPEKEVVIREIIRERIIERPVQEVRISVPSLPAGFLTPYPQAPQEVIRETIVRETTTAIDNTALNAMNTSIQAQIASLMTVVGQSSSNSESILNDLTDSNIPNDLTINSTKGLSATTGGFSGTLTVSGASSLTANVGISTTTPGAALGVKGSGLFGGNLVTSFIRATSTTATSTFDGGVRLARTAGNVGIGTSSPGSHMLAVAGDILIGGTSTSTFQGNVEIDGILKIGQGTSYLTANDLTASNGFTINSDVANKDIVLNSSGSVGFNTSTPWAFFAVDHDWADADKPVLVVADQGTSTPSLLIDWRGRVGIGTSTPGTRFAVKGLADIGSLFVEGVAKISNLISTSTTASGFGTTSPWGVLSIEQIASGNELLPAFVVSDVGTATPSFIVMNATQRIGVATTSPRFNLGIIGTGYISGNTGFGGILDIQGAGTSTFDGGISVTGKGIASSNGLVVSAGESYFTERVGVGTTSPYGALAIEQIASGEELLPAFVIGDTGTKTPSFIVMNATGRVGLGTTSPSLTFSVAGNILVGGTATNSFDNGIKLKTGCFLMPDGQCAGAGGGAATYLALTDTPSSFTAKSIPYTNTGATALLHSASLVFDGTNFGVGTDTPWGNVAIEHISSGNENLPAFVVSDTGTSSPSLVVMNSTGNVGIGVRSPSNLLALGSTSKIPVMSISSATSSPIWIKRGGDGMGWADATFDAVFTMEVNNGRLYAGLGITAGEAEVWEFRDSTWVKVGGDAVNGSWDGTNYELVIHLKSYNGRLYAGLGNTAGDSELWEFNGASWTKIGGDGINSSWNNSEERVQSIEVYQGNLYVGLGYVGAGFGKVWKYTGTTWTQIAGAGENGSWSDKEELLWLLTHNDKLYAATGQTLGDAEVWEYNGVTWTKIGGDAINSSWADATYQEVDTLVSYNGKLYAGLGWSTAGLAEVWEYDNDGSWTKVGGDGVNGSWNATDYENVMSFAVYNGKLYTGLGRSAGDSEVWVYNGSSWLKVGGDSLNSSWSGSTHEEVYSMQVFNGKLYAGTGYNTAGDAEVWEYNENLAAIAKSGVGLTVGNTLTIGSYNRVGIGISNPEADLDVLSSLRVGGSNLIATSSRVGIGTSTPWGTLSVEQQHSGNENLPAFVVSDVGTATPSFIVMNATQRIGVATTSPRFNLGIIGTGYISGNTGFGGILDIQGAGTSTFDGGISVTGKGIASSNGLVVSAGESYFTERVGVGTTSPGTLLSVKGLANFGSLTVEGAVKVSSLISTSTLSMHSTSQIPIITISSATGSPAWVQRGGDGIGGSWNTNYEYLNTAVSYNGRLYVGLGVTAGDAEVWEYNNSAWKQIGGDGLYASWAAATYEFIPQLTVNNGHLYASLGSSANDAEVWEYNGVSWIQIGGDSLYSSWGTGYDYVYSMSVFRGELVVGLSATAGEAEVWRYNGSAWTQIGGDSVNSSWTAAGLYEEVFSLATHNNNLYAGLGNTAADGEVWEFNGASWTQIGGDSLNSSWSSVTYVNYLLSFNGKLYAGTGSDAGMADVWEYNGSAWTQIGGDSLNSSWSTSYTQVQQLIAYNGKLYAGLGALAGQAEVWEYNGSTWTQIGGDTVNSSWDATNYERMQKAMAVHNGKLYAGVTGSTAGEAELWEYTTNFVAIAKSGNGLNIGNTLTIGANNRVGIGIIDPEADLDVLSSLRVGGSNLIATSSRVGIGTSTPWGTLSVEQQYSGNENLPAFVVSDVGTATPSFVILNGTGRTGVGTSSPWGQFSVEHATGGDNQLIPAFVVADKGTGTPSFIVLNKNGYVGVGTSSPWGGFSIEILASGSEDELPSFVVGDTGSSTPALAVYSSGVTQIDQLQTGALSFDTNAGAVSWIDMPVTSSAVWGTVESYSAQIDATSTLTVYSQSNGKGGVFRERVGIGTTTPGGTFSIHSGTSTQPALLIYQGQDTGEIIRVQTSDDTAALMMRGNGRVGLATTTPGSLLSVEGRANLGSLIVEGTSRVSSLISTSTALSGFGTSTPWGVLSVEQIASGDEALPAFIVGDTGTKTPSLIVKNGTPGVVGIGTINPAARSLLPGPVLNIGSGDAGTGSSLRLQSSSAYGDVDFSLAAGNALATLWVQSAHPLTFRTNATEYMRLDSTGNLGLGASTSPWGTLSVEQVASGDENLPAFVVSDSGTTSPALIVLNGTGRVGIGTTSPSRALSVSGISLFGSDVIMDSAITMSNLAAAGADLDLNLSSSNKQVFAVSSSQRYKDNITPIQLTTSATDIILQLEPASFTWNNKSATPGKEDFGLIAEEVYEIMPELVSMDSNGIPFGVIYAKLPVLLIKAFQELKAEVAQLDSTLTIETNNESLVADSSGLLAQVIDIVADWLRNAIVQVKKLIVGSPEAPTGITMYDLETRQPYCFVIRNGQPDYIPGECTFDVPAAEPIQEPVVEPIQEPVVEPIQEPVVEPIQEPVVEPIQEPVVEPIQEPVVEPIQEPITEETAP